MKVTQMKGDGKSLKNIELDAVMATMANEEYSREITLLRESLESIMPGRKNVHADKIPVLLFAAKFRKKRMNCISARTMESFWYRSIIWQIAGKWKR